MSTEKKQLSVDEHISRLERRARVIRSRLLRTVDALDTRRHQVTDAVAVAKHEAPRIGMSVLGIIAAAAGSVLGLRAYLKSRKERLLAFRVKRFVSQFRVEKRPPFALVLFQKVTITVVTMVVTEAARRAMKNTLDGRLADGRLAVHPALAAHHEELAQPTITPTMTNG